MATFLAGFMSLAVWTNTRSKAGAWVFAVLYDFFGGGYLIFPASLSQVAGYVRIPAAHSLLYFTKLFG